MISESELKAAFRQLYPLTVEMRQHIHRNPELSFEERETSLYIQSKLSEWGIEFRTGYAEHGIAATIHGQDDGPTVVLRADIDALPITEDDNHQCCSEREGVMHACGHDMHAASLLAVARFLSQNTDKFGGRVMLIFQPGEEVFPGGANVMMRDGLFDGIEPKVVIGAHVLADMPVGHVGFCSGAYMASGDEVHLWVRGHGGHGGMPHLLNDTVLASAQMIVAMQQIVAREVPATVPAVLSFGKVEADGATNVIPDTVYIAGTMRTLSEEWRSKMKKRIAQVAEGIALSSGCTCDIDIKDGYPSVYNNPEATSVAADAARALLGSECVETMGVRMTAEDFGYYSQRYPSVFYRFGVARTDKPTGGAHTSQFDPSEEALATAPAVMTRIALAFLNE